MKTNKDKPKKEKKPRRRFSSPPIRWKIFGFVMVPCLAIVIILWFVQIVFFGYFYSNTKTDELKRNTEIVINDMEREDIQDRIFFLASNGDMNFLVTDTGAFEQIYSSGAVFDSATHGLGSYGLFELYEEAKENGGETVRYYSHEKNIEKYIATEIKPTDVERDFGNDSKAVYESDETEDTAEERQFRDKSKRIPPPAVFGNREKNNDLMYAKITKLSDGREIMVVADTRISPLDSTVKTLRIQLILCTIIAVIISFIVSFAISRHVAKPIETINKTAKKLAQGNFDVEFKGKGYREIEQLNDTLNCTSVELSKVDTLRCELMANVSHDMRTPLTMIVGYGEVMRDIPGENNPENVQVIIDEANRLTRFVNSVLDLSKLQSGMSEYNPEKTNLTGMLRDVEERYRKLMLDENFEITLSCAGDEDVYIKCDEPKLFQVLLNLTDNAINYSNAPKKVVIKQTLNEDGNVRVEVVDNGNGIDKDELPYIWDRYYKTDKSHKRNVAGSGIGLSIVKEILKIHSARFGVQTQKGVGSTFWFELPVVLHE